MSGDNWAKLLTGLRYEPAIVRSPAPNSELPGDFGYLHAEMCSGH